MDQLPLVYAICPTYGRPELLRNSIACFQMQKYPVERRRVLIGDDGGQLTGQSLGPVEVISWPQRFRSITSKFNALADAALLRGADILVVWEDDDVYLPHHLDVHQQALLRGHYSKPSRVLSTYGRKLREEVATGRFHASIAITRHAYQSLKGWPETQRADFDQQFMSRLRHTFGEIDPCELAHPSYVFRWESTVAPHGQAKMKSADDVTWWERCRLEDLKPLPDWKPIPLWDAETLELMRWHKEQSAQP